MNELDRPAGTIVVGVDGSRQALRALAWAAEQAVAEHRQLTLAYAVTPLDATWLDAQGGSPAGESAEPDPGRHPMLVEARELLARRCPDVEVHEVVRTCDPRELLLDLGADAAMLVVGSRGRGPVRTLLLGSVGVSLVRHPPCPVVVHRPGNPGIVRTGVVAGVDGTARSAPVLELGYRIAAQRDLPLTIVRGYPDDMGSVPGFRRADGSLSDLEGERLGMAEAVAGLGEKYPEVRAQTELVRGSADSVLAARSDRAHLVVMGAHHGGLPTELMFGSVTTDVVEHASCPVAVVPIDGR